MKRDPGVFDFGSDLAAAREIASQKDVEARELLWGRIAARAVQDDSFRDELNRNPEEVISKEARSLNVSVAPADVQKAKEVFSTAVPVTTPQRVEELVFGTIDDVRKSFRLTLYLAVAVFVVGTVLLVIAVSLSLWRGQDTATVVFGVGGVLSLIATLVMNPMDRIRRAGANLVQIQMAYLAYYSQLHLLGSRKDGLAPTDVVVYAKELREAATSMVATVQTALGATAALSGGHRAHLDHERENGSCIRN